MTSHQFGLLVLECQNGLFDWPADVCMSRGSLEVGGRKLGKLVIRKVLLGLKNWEREI